MYCNIAEMYEGDLISDAYRQIDLLGAVGIPEDAKTGVTYTAGLDGYPTFLLTEKSNVREPAQLFFGSSLFGEFAIIMTLQPYHHNGGFVFAVVNPYQTIISFGIQISGSDDGQQNIALYFTPNPRFAETSEIIANFTVPSMVNIWSKVSLKVLRERVVLYINCREQEQIYWFRRVEHLTFEPGSSLYIGAAGPNVKRDVPNFEVSTFLLTK